MNTTEHLLVCLMEECAEVQQATSKILRFGLNHKYPGTDITNLKQLLVELLDVVAVTELLENHIDFTLPDNEAEERFEAKKEKVLEYIEYAKTRGTITDVK